MKKELAIPAIGLLFWALYLVSLLDIDRLWGINFINFLPFWQQIILFSLTLLLIVLSPLLYSKFSGIQAQFFNFKKVKPLALIFSLILFHQLNIFENVYGDAMQFIYRMGDSTTSISSKYILHLFSLDLSNPKLGNHTVLSFIRLISYTFNITHQLAFKLLGILSGLLFVNLSFNYIRDHIKTGSLQWVLLFFTILAPFCQLFLGHYEIYAPLMPAIAWYLIQLRKLVKKPQKGKLILFTLALLLCIKLHFTSVLLIPSFFFVLGLVYKQEKCKTLIKWSFILKWLITPFIVFGSVVYFFILKDYKDERFLNTSVDLYDRLFLPILSPEAPLDRYNLFSFNHIFDYINMSFLWSAAGIFILIILFLFYRKKISFNRPEIVLTGFSLLLYVLVFFAFNPLLAMPIDFDLFSITAPTFFFFVLFLLEDVDSDQFVKMAGGSIIGISLFSIAIFQCNHSQESLSKRMESVGKHIFKSYWIRSAGDIESGIALIKDQPDKYISRYHQVAEDLRPYAVLGKDSEYAHILWSIGKFYRNQKEYQKALEFHLESETYSTALAANYIGLMESNYYLEDYAKAYQYSLNLITLNYPNEKKAQEIAIDCALMAGFKHKALNHIESYLTKWDNQNYRIIANKLKNE